MVAFLRSKRIASYKLPERLEILDRFPMGPGGDKIAKRELAALVTEKLRAEGRMP